MKRFRVTSGVVADLRVGNRGHEMADKTKKVKKSKSASKSASKPASKSASKTKAKSKVDPITLSVIRGILETTQREMTLSLEKTARSSVFNLAHDYSTALFNHVPEMILQGQTSPFISVRSSPP
jgi:hypothetical protein